MQKKYIAPFVCGFGAAVLSIVPGLKSITCCILIPLSAALSLFLDQKINKLDEIITSGKAVMFGLLTGLFAAVFSSVFDIILTFITRTNDLIESIPQTESFIRTYDLGPLVEETLKALKAMASDIKKTGFSVLYTITMLFSNLLIDTIFGLMGALLGMNFINRKRNRG